MGTLWSQAEPIVCEGGASPDGKWAVAVLANVEMEDYASDPAPPTRLSVAYLMDAKNKKIIGPLEDVFVDGGGRGRTLENVKILWSPDSRFFAANRLLGKLMWDFDVHRIQGRRAILLKELPLDLPHWKEVEAGLESSDYPRRFVRRWTDSRHFVVAEYGHRPKNRSADVDPVYDNGVEKVYAVLTASFKVTAARASSPPP